MPNTFRNFLKNLVSISDEKVTEIENKGVRKLARAKHLIFKADSPFLKLLFLEEGLLRAYRTIDGKDITFFFFTSEDFAVDYESFLLETKSPLFFEAMADTHYIEFSKASILALYDQYPEFDRIGRFMGENAYLSATRRLKEFQAESLESRYLKLLRRNPELFQQVPQYHIASYLGVNPQSISRLRAKFQNKIY